MIVEAQVNINGTREAVWTQITDIENAKEFITGIEGIEVVEKPADGFTGFRWRETRMYFGDPATVEKWVTDSAENEFYETKAEMDGFVFVTTMRIAENSDGGATLTSSHESIPQGFVARLKSLPIFLFKGVIKKALMQDLTDVKAAVEQQSPVEV